MLLIQLLCTSRSNYRNKYTSLSFLVFDVLHKISTHCSDKRSRSWARIQRTTEMMKYSSQGQAARVSRELKTSLSTPPERSVPPAGGGKWSRLTKRRRARLGWSRGERKRRTRKGERRGYFCRRCVLFQTRVEITAVEITAQKLFPPLHIRKTASEVQK